jgi:hypothetical protein
MSPAQEAETWFVPQILPDFIFQSDEFRDRVLAASQVERELRIRGRLAEQ